MVGKCSCFKLGAPPVAKEKTDAKSHEDEGVQLEITDGHEEETNGNGIISPVEKPPSIKGCPIDQGGAREILQLMNPTTEQVEFFDTWMETIGSQASNVDSKLSFCTDGSNFEYSITGKCKGLPQLVEEMIVKCEMPTEGMDKMEEMIKELRCEKMTLWCKLKNIPCQYVARDRGLPPAIDLGYTLHSPLSWTVCDLLMPNVHEHELIRDYTQGEKNPPVGFGASLLPIETEHRLLFRHDTSDTSIAKMSALFFFNFFKSLGFPKPEDGVISVLTSCEPTEYIMVVSMGPKGLTRLSASLENPSSVIHKDLCAALDFPCGEKLLAYAGKYFGGHPSSIEYNADSGGYSCCVAYTS